MRVTWLSAALFTSGALGATVSRVLPVQRPPNAGNGGIASSSSLVVCPMNPSTVSQTVTGQGYSVIIDDCFGALSTAYFVSVAQPTSTTSDSTISHSVTTSQATTSSPIVQAPPPTSSTSRTTSYYPTASTPPQQQQPSPTQPPAQPASTNSAVAPTTLATTAPATTATTTTSAAALSTSSSIVVLSTSSTGPDPRLSPITVPPGPTQTNAVIVPHRGLSTAAIGAIAGVGSAVILIILVILLLWSRRKRKQRLEEDELEWPAVESGDYFSRSDSQQQREPKSIEASDAGYGAAHVLTRESEMVGSPEQRFSYETAVEGGAYAGEAVDSSHAGHAAPAAAERYEERAAQEFYPEISSVQSPSLSSQRWSQ